jgi:hypothetical protein
MKEYYQDRNERLEHIAIATLSPQQWIVIKRHPRDIRSHGELVLVAKTETQAKDYAQKCNEISEWNFWAIRAGSY